MSNIRQNFHCDSELAINKQINVELQASYVYLNLSFYFDRNDVALEGCAKFFSKLSDAKLETATSLMKYQNKRGGRVTFANILNSDISQVKFAKDAMKFALDLEKSINASLLNLHDLASKVKDPHFSEYLEEHLMEEQVNRIKMLGNEVTNVERVGMGIGEYMFDHELNE